MPAEQILLIDLGNTALKCRLCSGDASSVRPKCQVVDFSLTYTDSGDWPERLKDFLAQQDFTQLALASVAEPAIVTAVEHVLASIDKTKNYHTLKTLRQLGEVINGYEDYTQLGVDRWLTLLAVRQMIKSDAVIIDAGTALKIDLLRHESSQNCLHLGGAILPGLHTNALHYQRLLQRLSFDATRPVDVTSPARSTADAVALGYALHSNLSLDEILGGWWHLLSSPVAIIVTGGDRQEIAERLSRSSQCINDLVFQGMLIQISRANEIIF